jgi:hypothetical protein
MKFFSDSKLRIEKRKLEVVHLDMPYIERKIIIDKENVDRFIRPEWHRDFYEAHVSKIAGGLLAGIHPSESITVNYKSESKDYRVINGNHRMAAIKKVIENHPEFSIVMGVKCYKDLTSQEERDLYILAPRVDND